MGDNTSRKGLSNQKEVGGVCALSLSLRMELGHKENFVNHDSFVINQNGEALF